MATALQTQPLLFMISGRRAGHPSSFRTEPPRTIAHCGSKARAMYKRWALSVAAAPRHNPVQAATNAVPSGTALAFVCANPAVKPTVKSYAFAVGLLPR